MTEDAEILQMNIQHYEALLRGAQDEGKRRQIEKLLAEMRTNLQLATQPVQRRN